jgi:hypothetical protein
VDPLDGASHTACPSPHAAYASLACLARRGRESWRRWRRMDLCWWWVAAAADCRCRCWSSSRCACHAAPATAPAVATPAVFQLTRCVCRVCVLQANDPVVVGLRWAQAITSVAIAAPFDRVLMLRQTQSMLKAKYDIAAFTVRSPCPCLPCPCLLQLRWCPCRCPCHCHKQCCCISHCCCAL